MVELANAAAKAGIAVIAITDGPLSPLVASAKVCLSLADDSSKPFRSLVAPLCLAQTLVVSTGHQLAEQGVGTAAKAAPHRKKKA